MILYEYMYSIDDVYRLDVHTLYIRCILSYFIVTLAEPSYWIHFLLVLLSDSHPFTFPNPE